MPFSDVERAVQRDEMSGLLFRVWGLIHATKSQLR